MDVVTNDFYNQAGINRDVNPFMQRDQDLQMATNFYTPRYGSKKVRFGYAPFLNAVDNQPVRNLFYYNLPNQTGILRYSNKKIYRTTTFAGTWGSSELTLTKDVSLAMNQLDGSKPYAHFTNDTDGYYTFDGAAYNNWTTGATPKGSTMAAWQSRIFTDINKRLFAESAVSFDLNPGYTVDPFAINNNDPGGGGTNPLNAGKDGNIQFMTSSIDRVHVYKQFGIMRYNGSSFMKLPFFGNILSVTSTKSQLDYLLATNGIFKNTGNDVPLADFGVHTVLQETIDAHGINNPVSFSFGDYTFFFVGTIRMGSGDTAVDIPNGMFVHHEQFDEWTIWSLGHQMTAFGFYVDPTTNEPVMISGDVNGNTYKWGELYSSDAGIPISYHLRSAYHHFGKPTASNIPEAFVADIKDGDNVSLAIAVDYTDEYKEEQTTFPERLKRKRFNRTNAFKTISFEFFGSTTTNRPEINGYSIRHKDNEERENGQGGQKFRN
jgi:hypothetical protein